MVSALHSFIKADKVLFGTRECVKNAKKIQKIFVSKDIRSSSLESLEKTRLEIEYLDVDKGEITDKLALAFFCEAFGVQK